MKVSVVIPLYNKAPYILRAIDSVLRQTYKEFEIIVVDDGSTDGGNKIVDSVKDPRLKLLIQSNKGPGSARNAGILESKYELLAFLDADDEWLPEYLQTGISLLLENPNCVAIAQGHYRNSLVQSMVPRYISRGLYEGAVKISKGTDLHYFGALHAYMSPWSTIFRKSTLFKYGGFFDKYKCLYGEDAYLMLKILLNDSIYTHLTPNTIYHTEASELAFTTDHPHEVEPFLLDTDDIRQWCPNDLIDLLNKVLFIRAINTAKLYAKFGDRKTSKYLLRKHYYCGFRDADFRKAMYMANFASFLPFFRKVYHWSNCTLGKVGKKNWRACSIGP